MQSPAYTMGAMAVWVHQSFPSTDYRKYSIHFPWLYVRGKCCENVKNTVEILHDNARVTPILELVTSNNDHKDVMDNLTLVNYDSIFFGLKLQSADNQSYIRI